MRLLCVSVFDVAALAKVPFHHHLGSPENVEAFLAHKPRRVFVPVHNLLHAARSRTLTRARTLACTNAWADGCPYQNVGQSFDLVFGLSLVEEGSNSGA